MITAYLVGISNYYEGEDIEIRFQAFKEGELLFKENFFEKYRKPAVVEHVALLELLKRLEAFKEDEITVMINNPSLYEQIRGTSTTKYKEAIKMGIIVREKLNEFGNAVIIKDVSNDKAGLKKWKEILEG